jgi:dye decolorizing peroxidase
MGLPDSELPRRRYLRGLVAAGGTAALAACLDVPGSGTDIPQGDPAQRPARQHAWEGALPTDEDGNTRRPNHHALLALDLTATPDEAASERVETAFRSLERAYGHDVTGLLFTVSYTPAYFETVGADSPVPDPEPLTSVEGGVALDEFHALVHLASDDPSVVLEAEQALFGEASEPNGVETSADLTGIFERAEPRRTGFVGSGLPVEQAEERGVDLPDELPEEAPFLMGFRSGFRESQASEERVTIQEGPYAGGTTAHVESLSLNLRQWFEQNDQQLRISELFSPRHTEEDVGEMGEQLGSSTGVFPDIAEQTETDAETRGLVGHAQKAARAREDGAPLLLRRDINTLDGDRPGVHFLAHQREIADYVRVRQAMAGEDLDGVGQRLNNGLLQYIFVRRRGNFLTPPRDMRALPGVGE